MIWGDSSWGIFEQGAGIDETMKKRDGVMVYWLWQATRKS